jgi:uncharacterized protein (DUF302 family)
MYGFSTRFNGDFNSAIEKVTAALAEEGFGVLTEIDVKAVMKKKLDLDKRPYTILGACNPNFANQALEADADIGLLLPCNVVVREEEDGSTTVAFMDPESVLGLVNRDEVSQLGMEVKQRLKRVCDALSA